MAGEHPPRGFQEQPLVAGGQNHTGGRRGFPLLLELLDCSDVDPRSKKVSLVTSLAQLVSLEEPPFSAQYTTQRRSLHRHIFAPQATGAAAASPRVLKLTKSRKHSTSDSRSIQALACVPMC